MPDQILPDYKQRTTYQPFKVVQLVSVDVITDVHSHV